MAGTTSYVLCDSKVLSWGGAQYGQLGLGDFNPRVVPEEITTLPSDITFIASAPFNALALSRNGKLYTWGRGQSKVNGHGNTSPLPHPTEVDINSRIVAADLSESHAIAVDTDGAVWTWGAIALGHDGNGLTPQKLDPSLFNNAKVTSVAAGTEHSLAVTEKGELFVWGRGAEGALGLGGPEDQVLPRQVSSLKNIRAVRVVAGHGFSMLLTDDGKLLTFGLNEYGQTGHGHLDRYVREPTQVRALKRKVVSIAAGESHAGCIDEDGHVFVWGMGNDGQLGNGAKSMHNATPQVVNLPGSASALALGGAHSAAIANGTIWVWGRGKDGQLGRADQMEAGAARRLTPLALTTLSAKSPSSTAVSLGRDFSIALVQKP